jgi:hypothetical protein
LTGTGNWFWVGAQTLDFYAVGASGTPSATFTFPILTGFFVSGGTLGAMGYGVGDVAVIDLSGSTLVRTSYTVPTRYNSVYAAASAAQWIIANRHGVVVDATDASTPRYFDLGRAWSIAGGAQRAAVATASGRILYFDPASKAEEGRIEFAASTIGLSDDGRVLIAIGNSNDAQYYEDRTLKVYSLPSGVEVLSRPGSYPNAPYPVDVVLSSSGGVFGTVDVAGARNVFTIDGTLIWTDTPAMTLSAQEAHVVLSPNGSLAAAPDRERHPNTNTLIVLNGARHSAAPGWPVAWIDDTRLLLNRYRFFALFPRYDRAVIVDALGNVLATPALPELTTLQPVGSDTGYSPAQNRMYSLTTGQPVWTSASPTRGRGAVSGGRVVFASGAVVRTEPY